MRVLSALGLALALSACAALAPRLETPELSIVNVELGESDLWQQHLKVRMRVQNPNERALPIRGLTYTLEVAGEPLASGISGASFTVPALGEAEFDMDIRANLAGALVRLLGREEPLAGDQLDYRIVGKVSLSEGLVRSVPFEKRGSFKLR